MLVVAGSNPASPTKSVTRFAAGVALRINADSYLRGSRVRCFGMTAARTLEPFADDGPLYSFDDAPLGAPFTPEERAEFDAAVAEHRAGRARAIPGEVVHAELQRASQAMKRFGAAGEAADVTVGEILGWLDTGEASPGIAALLASEHAADAAE